MKLFFEYAKEFKKAGPEKTILLFFNLRGMKYFNFNYGFTEGDKLIASAGALLCEYFGIKKCSRLGQDHFAAITRCEDIKTLIEDIIHSFRNINRGRTLPVHIGVYVWEGKTDIDAACDRAKFACDCIKNTAVSTYKIFTDNMLKLMSDHNYIIEHLDQAINENWITAYYQPIIRAATGRICDEEALARWNDPNRGMISPADFVPILEDNNLIYKLDLHIVDLILEKLKIQTETGIPLVPQCINLSRTDFDACDIVEEIRERVDRFGIGRNKINIEITESTIGVNFDFMKEQINKFRKLGFSVWIDDFGTGYSSFECLQEIKFDVVKIDMKFVQKYGKNEQNPIILTEIVKLINRLGMESVAEGIETKEQLEFLKKINCTKLQGFYFSQAMSTDQIFKKWVSGDCIEYENT